MLGGWVCELEGDTFGTLRRRRLVQRDSLGQIDRERGERGRERVEGRTLVDMQSEIVDESAGPFNDFISSTENERIVL